MHLVHKYFLSGKKSEDGFVLIAAILATMIMIAVGLYALTTTTQDMRISVQLVGERTALSAAETGVHRVCILLDPAALAVISGQVDPTDNKSTTSYTTTNAPVRSTVTPTIPVPGFDMSKAYVGSVWNATVTGNDSKYNSSVSIAIGTVYSPNPGDTQQGGR